MKHFILFAVLLIATVATGKAQSTQVATLSHEGTVTTFSGTYGLKDAYQQAVDGDVITLSSGTFMAQNFEKRITVRGAGMGVKVNASDPYIEPTQIVGNFKIKADGNDENKFKLEGIVCEESTVELAGVSNAMFSKCRIDKLDYSTGQGGFNNVTFINCILGGGLCYNSTMNFYGCFLRNLNTQRSGSLHNMINCIIEMTSSREYVNCMVKNSIYLNYYNNQSNGAQSYFSIWSGETFSSSSQFIKTLEDHSNSIVPEGMPLFKEGTFYQLTDEAKQYLGDDGTEIGIYGGSLPFDPTPTNPQIIRFNVAPKTTADGKLSVDIEVNAE